MEYIMQLLQLAAVRGTVANDAEKTTLDDLDGAQFDVRFLSDWELDSIGGGTDITNGF
jgi:hypothetical protein